MSPPPSQHHPPRSRHDGIHRLAGSYVRVTEKQPMRAAVLLDFCSDCKRQSAGQHWKASHERHSERSRGIPWRSLRVIPRDVSTSLDMTVLFYASGKSSSEENAP